VIEFPDGTVAEDKLIVEVAAKMVPGTTVIVGSVEVIADPPIVALIEVAVPDTTALKVAV
jgi:hypothetical protein